MDAARFMLRARGRGMGFAAAPPQALLPVVGSLRKVLWKFLFVLFAFLNLWFLAAFSHNLMVK
jgi:hypothetical protein